MLKCCHCHQSPFCLVTPDSFTMHNQTCKIIWMLDMNRVELSWALNQPVVKTAPIVRGINYNETDKHKLGCGASSQGQGRSATARPLLFVWKVKRKQGLLLHLAASDWTPPEFQIRDLFSLRPVPHVVSLSKHIAYKFKHWHCQQTNTMYVLKKYENVSSNYSSCIVLSQWILQIVNLFIH